MIEKDTEDFYRVPFIHKAHPTRYERAGSKMSGKRVTRGMDRV